MAKDLFDDTNVTISTSGGGGLEVRNEFVTNAIDDYTTASTTYICKEDSGGEWWIIKIDETGNFPVFTHATVTNNPTYTTYATAYAARTSLTYNAYATAF